MLKILKIRGFIAYLAIAFLNAFTDLGHKIIIQNTIFKYYSGDTQIILTAIVNSFIVLPFVLFFTPTGFLSDKYPKDRIVKIAAFTAIPLTGLITLSYYMGWFEIAFLLTLLLGTQAAFYSPAKYGYIKELTGKENIAAANAYVQAVTIIAILGGTVAFSALFEQLIAPHFQTIPDIVRSIAPLGWLLVGCSTLEFLLALRLEQKRPTDETMQFNVKQYASFGYLRKNLRGVRRSQVIWLSIVGIAVFWGINQTVLASFPAYMKETLGVENTTVANGLMGLGGLGIIIGSFIAGKASEEFIETGIVPLGALGLTAVLFVLPAIHSLWVLAAMFLVYGIMGGLFIIPLNALIQFNASSDEAGTVLAANNFMQNLLMVLFLGLTALLTSLYKLDTVFILYAMAVVALAGSIYALSKLPQAFIRYMMALLVTQRYKLSVLGMKNIPSSGGVLLLGNHASWFDWAVLQIACPRPIRFVMIRSIYENPALKPFLRLFGVIPIAPGKDADGALVNVHEALQQGEVVALFPEGRISRNGQLADFKRGFERAVQGTNAVIVPFYLRGLWGSSFSSATPTLRRSGIEHGFVDKRFISVSFGGRIPNTSTAAEVKQKVLGLSVQAWRQYSDVLTPIHHAWLGSAKMHGGKMALVDGKQRFTHTELLTATIAFATALKTQFSRSKAQAPNNHVGVLLPTSTDAAFTTFALWMNGLTPVLLDYSSGVTDIARGITMTSVLTVITSKAFVATLSEQFPETASILAGMNILYTEDLRGHSSGGKSRTARTLTVKLLPKWLLRLLYFNHASLDDTAAIFFAGNTDSLKAVELTHRNIMGNIKQIAEVLNPHENDVVLSVLPFCTAFGGVVTMLLPLVNGLTVVCQADAVDILALGKQAARTQATVLFATPTFLERYAAEETFHPLMFATLRLVVSGGKPLNNSIRTAFKQKFGLNIYEGFGTTETTPVATVNVPDVMTPGDWKVQTGQKIGTFGLPLPGSTLTIVHPDTLAELPIGEQGTVLIGGPQIMKGYWNNSELTARVLLDRDGMRWYKTNMTGRLDADGFLTIDD